MSERVYSAVDALAWLTECNLATLEELKDIKSTSLYRIQRQQNICDEAVRYFMAYGSVEIARRLKCGRVADILEGV